jgi:iron complex transport system ATP-binding protein
LAVADNALLMLGGSEVTCGPVDEVLNEPNLHRLYGVDIKRLSFEYKRRTIETLVPVYAKTHSPRGSAP